MNLKKQLACIYTNNFFSGLRITDAVWVARRRFIKPDKTQKAPSGWKGPS